jgi:hypothetical protein
MFNQLNNARLLSIRQKLGLSSSTTLPHIKVRQHPFPPTKTQRLLVDSTAALVVGIAFAFIPASIVGWVVKERQTKVKHLQMISGVSTLAYWIATWIWDFCSFMVFEQTLQLDSMLVDV